MKLEDAITRMESLNSPLEAIEALWDGDSSGWFIFISCVTADQQSHPLGTISQGSDMRLLNGEIPPWPEATKAKEVGTELASRFNIEFYFPSPDHPEDRCPGWSERDRGYPCRQCGIQLLQEASLPWHGWCHECHLARECTVDQSN